LAVAFFAAFFATFFAAGRGGDSWDSFGGLGTLGNAATACFFAVFVATFWVIDFFATGALAASSVDFAFFFMMFSLPQTCSSFRTNAFLPN
jgi:hypothetical protein